MGKFKGKKASERIGHIDSGSVNALIGRPSGSAHKLVLETATAMAHELYDTLMQKDDWYKLWKSWHDESATAAQLEESFVKRNVPGLLAGARTILAQSLATTPDAALRQTIFDALLLDATLVGAGGRGVRGLS